MPRVMGMTRKKKRMFLRRSSPNPIAARLPPPSGADHAAGDWRAVMPCWSSNLQRRIAWVALACCLGWHASYAATPNADTDAYLEQTQALATLDHSRFLQQLALLNKESSRLTPDQLWHLRYSNAWEAMYESDYAKSEALFQDIIQHAGNPALADKASATLLGQLVLTRRYPEAFELANRLATRLPQVTDAEVR